MAKLPFGHSAHASGPPATKADLAETALAAAGLAEFIWDAQSDCLKVSARLAKMTGLAEGEFLTRQGLALEPYWTPENQDAVSAAVRQLLAGGERVHFRVRPKLQDDPERWLEVIASAVYGPRGDLGALTGVVRDVSARSGPAEDPGALTREFDHRVKNLLASVQSLAAQSARHSPSMDDFLTSFVGRLDAVATVHTLLAATRWRGAEIAAIASAELSSVSQGQARWDGPDIMVNPRAANALTLVLHELVANAGKFGALSLPEGRVKVVWRNLDLGGFELEWTETGGPRPQPEVRRGFGRTLIDRVIGRELGGTAALQLLPEGVRVLLTSDASALADSDLQERTRADRPPVADAVAGASSGADETDDIRGVRVLIVEDAVLLALELEAGLTEAGAQVVGVAGDLEEARRLVGLDFDVAVLDANLNGHSVMPIAHTLAARGTPFIIATGYRDADLAANGFDAPVVRKPYNVRQIATALTAALRMP